MPEENVSQKFRLNNIDEIKNYLIKEMNQNELMSKKDKKVCRKLSCIEYLIILISTVTGCVSISAFAFLVRIPIGITIFAVGFKVCVITAGREKYKSIITKKKTKHDKIVLLAKSKLKSIEVLIAKVLINSNITYDQFVLINNVLEDLYDMNKVIKNYNDK